MYLFYLEDLAFNLLLMENKKAKQTHFTIRGHFFFVLIYLINIVLFFVSSNTWYLGRIVFDKME